MWPIRSSCYGRRLSQAGAKPWSVQRWRSAAGGEASCRRWNAIAQPPTDPSEQWSGIAVISGLARQQGPPCESLDTVGIDTGLRLGIEH